MLVVGIVLVILALYLAAALRLAAMVVVKLAGVLVPRGRGRR